MKPPLMLKCKHDEKAKALRGDPTPARSHANYDVHVNAEPHHSRIAPSFIDIDIPGVISIHAK
jgi:hypothetical protein